MKKTAKAKEPQTQPETVEEKEVPVEETAEAAPGTAEEAPKSELEIRLEKAEKERDDYLGTAQRVQAEFDNFRKRNASARTDALEDGNRKAVEAILPVLDNLERTLDAMQGLDGNYRQGIEMVLRQMKDVLEKLGLEEIEAAGAEFDPNIHNAVLTCPADDEHAAGMVVNVLQKGYKVHGKVIRASMVQVAQ